MNDDDNTPTINSSDNMKELVRVTPEGLLYVTDDHIPGPAMDNKGGDGPMGRRRDKRGLQIGADTRSRIDNVFEAPYWKLVRLSNGCSGSIVGPDKVLTAAHCVFESFDNIW